MKNYKVGDILTKKSWINSLENFKKAQEILGRSMYCSELTQDHYEYYQKFFHVKKVKITSTSIHEGFNESVFKKSKLSIFIEILDYDKRYLSDEEIRDLQGHYYPIEFFDGFTEKLDKILKV